MATKKNLKTEEMSPAMKESMEKKKRVKTEVNKLITAVKKAPKIRKERVTMTIGQTKLGVTMVLSKEDCLKLGYKETDPTKLVIKEIKMYLLNSPIVKIGEKVKEA